MRVFVLTCAAYHWALQPFSYLFNLYWSGLQEVVVGGALPPPFPLPANFHWHTLRSRDYPKEQWTNQVIDFLTDMTDDVFVWLLDDYWLQRTVDHEAVRSLGEFMRDHPDVLKIDLTADRLYSGHAVDRGAYGRLDIIETDWNTHYQLSTQAAIWNRRSLLSILKPGLSPWEFELHLQGQIPAERHGDLRILGTRQWPVRYANGSGMGHKAPWLEGIPQDHVDEMRRRGYFKAVEET